MSLLRRARQIHSQVARSEATRDFILSVLHTTATKREAKQYMAKYAPRLLPAAQPLRPALSESRSDNVDLQSKQPLRLSIIKLRDIDAFSDKALNDVAQMVQQLARLGASPIFVLDADKERSHFVASTVGASGESGSYLFKSYRDCIMKKANRLVSSIDPVDRSTAGNRAASQFPITNEDTKSGQIKAWPIHGIFEVVNRSSIGNLQPVLLNSILQPLKRNVIPILLPIAYDGLSGDEKLVNADRLILSLVSELQSPTTSQKIPYSVEKIIFIDPLGGTPSDEREGSHFFVNFSQEFDKIKTSLSLGSSKDWRIHLQNLESMRSILSVLPSEVTGMITSPKAAGKRISKNPVLYNLLTDRPMVSPSLPVTMKRTPALTTTIFRRGMPVKYLYSEDGLDLVKEDKIGTVDLMELTALINNSFGKTLDLKHYLDRVNGKVAGLIIAGDYEGAAIITWEKAKGSNHKVAYLDKFAVRTTSQGSSGVADIVFKEMVSQMFPDEILWRSRRNNPVNKWYFERSRGTVRVPESHWTMFWAGAQTREETILDEYLKICSSIEPSLH